MTSGDSGIRLISKWMTVCRFCVSREELSIDVKANLALLEAERHPGFVSLILEEKKTFYTGV